MKKYHATLVIHHHPDNFRNKLCGNAHQLGPFILGHDIAEFAEFVQMDTSLPIRHMESIQEVETKPIKGFKSGLIAYCTCAAPNSVVRIKLKYSDSSKSFYHKLKKRIEKRFGKCDEYRGDPFHIVIGWKWSFMDKDNNKISLILQHNIKDEEEKMGNSIKLTMTNLLESDWECSKEKKQMEKASGRGRTTGTGTRTDRMGPFCAQINRQIS